jgi:hypothetical protein
LGKEEESKMKKFEDSYKIGRIVHLRDFFSRIKQHFWPPRMSLLANLCPPAALAPTLTRCLDSSIENHLKKLFVMNSNDAIHVRVELTER